MFNFSWNFLQFVIELKLNTDKMDARLMFAVVFAVLQSTPASSNPYLCLQGEFYSFDKMECVPCSDCPANQVHLRACSKDRDTLCGPLGKFQFRQPVFKQPVTADVDVNPETDVTQLLPVPKQTTVVVADDISDSRWFTITMVLVGLLVFMCVLGVVLLFITCYVCKKNKKREIICDPVFTSSLLRPDEETGIRKIEQFKLVTET